MLLCRMFFYAVIDLTLETSRLSLVCFKACLNKAFTVVSLHSLKMNIVSEAIGENYFCLSKNIVTVRKVYIVWNLDVMVNIPW